LLGARSGEEGFEDLVAEGGDGDDGADGVGRHGVAAGAAGFDNQRMDRALLEAGGADDRQVVRKLRKIFEDELNVQLIGLFAGFGPPEHERLYGDGHLFSSAQAERILLRRNPRMAPK